MVVAAVVVSSSSGSFLSRKNNPKTFWSFNVCFIVIIDQNTEKVKKKMYYLTGRYKVSCEFSAKRLFHAREG